MPECMQLLVKPVAGSEELVKEYYGCHGTFHDGDAGLDLFCLEDLTIPARWCSIKMPLGVCMEAYYRRESRWHDTRSGERGGRTYHEPTAFYLYPRSSTGAKTPIRLSNSVGIIDAGYRGPLTAILAMSPMNRSQ